MNLAIPVAGWLPSKEGSLQGPCPSKSPLSFCAFIDWSSSIVVGSRLRLMSLPKGHLHGAGTENIRKVGALLLGWIRQWPCGAMHWCSQCKQAVGRQRHVQRRQVQLCSKGIVGIGGVQLCTNVALLKHFAVACWIELAVMLWTNDGQLNCMHARLLQRQGTSWGKAMMQTAHMKCHSPVSTSQRRVYSQGKQGQLKHL